MIVLYAEKEDMGIQYAAALGGIPYKGKMVETDELSAYSNLIKKEIADKQGYLRTTYQPRCKTPGFSYGDIRRQR